MSMGLFSDVSSIHSGPMATRHSPLAKTPCVIETMALEIVGEAARLLVAHEGLSVTDTSAAIMTGLSNARDERSPP